MKYQNKISATVVADSINEFSCRLISLIIIVPRIVLAEFNTHRMFSRNSASSRAIPFKKMLALVRNEPFVPIKWMKDHSGMQGNDYFEGKKIWLLRNLWLTARTVALCMAWTLSKVGLTKQICNRLLEPFMWHTILTTASEWENFMSLRAHNAAEIHINYAAFKIMEAINKSTPKYLEPGEWHIPFGDKISDMRLRELVWNTIDRSGHESLDDAISKNPTLLEDYKVMIATARCARISYNNFEGKDDYYSDVKLHGDLDVSGHRSPFEHCAKSMTKEEYYSHISGVIEEAELLEDGSIKVKFIDEKCFGWSGNFRGFLQYRKMFTDENRSDRRLVTK